MWARPEVLENYAVHYGDRRADARDLLDRVLATQTFNRGSRPPSTSRPSILDRHGTRSRSTRLPGAAGSSVRGHGPRRPAASPLDARAARATAALLLATSGAAATPPATTPTSGARCSTLTPSSGSVRTGACVRENGDHFGGRSCPAAEASRRSTSTARPRRDPDGAAAPGPPRPELIRDGAAPRPGPPAVSRKRRRRGTGAAPLRRTSGRPSAR